MTQELVPGAPPSTRLLGNRYRLGGLLGRGGMASVYRAEDELLGRTVAVKVFGQEAESRRGDRERSEMTVLASLNHPALVTVFDANIDAQPHPYLVMEFVDGPPLNVRLASGPVAASDVASMTKDLSEALMAVHAAGIVHRDIKPSNVLLATRPGGLDFRAKLADFGIAALVDAARLTVPGTLMGTAAYLAPEQLQDASPAPAADIYSLGLVMLECLTGERAFPGTPAESMSRRLVDDPGIPQSVPVAMRPLISAMTARDPVERPTASEVIRLAETAAQDLMREKTSDGLATMAVATDPAMDGATRVLPVAHPRTAPTVPVKPAAGVSPGATMSEKKNGHPRRKLAVVGFAAVVLVIGAVALIPRGTPAAHVEIPAMDAPLGTHIQQLLDAVTP